MLAGVQALIGLILRRDRVKLPIMIVSFVALLLLMVPLLRQLYGDPSELAMLHATFGANPAGLFMTGPMDQASFGGLMTIETLIWWGMALAFMNTMLVVRHTRQNEELGSQELILSGQTHRSSSLTAALVAAFCLNLVVTVGVGVGMILLGESSWGTKEAWLYATALGVSGMAWATIAAVVVQLTDSARSANGLLAALIGGSFIVRGVGDFLGKTGASGLHEPMWLSWLSPLGWLQAVRPLTAPEWMTLAVPIGAGVLFVIGAYWLLEWRDVGSGIVPSRSGKARASRFLQTPLGLTWALQKNIFIGWLTGVTALVASIGVLVPEMSSAFDDSDAMKQLLSSIGGAGALVPSFLSIMLSITVIMIFAYALHGMGRLRSEEASGHLEHLLATKVSRLQWAGLHAVVVLAGGVVMLAASGALLAMLVNAMSDFKVDIVEYIVAGLSYAPILTLFVGAYVFLFATVPRLAGAITWLYFGFVGFMSWIGPMLKLDPWVANISATEHIATPPAEEILLTPLLVIFVISFLLLVFGMTIWRHRDLLER